MFSHHAPRKPPLVNQQRAGAEKDLTMRYIDRRFDDQEVIAGPAICERCHAYLETDHWRYGEKRYLELKAQPGIATTLCPGCTRAERRMYEGEVRIRSNWDAISKDDVVHLIHNEEHRERATNPTARVALMMEHDEELYLLTTTEFLAKRIGRELEKAYKGTLRLMHLPRERFTRVVWEHS
ncbi:MAG: BCAM0308 family protein [Armatimonadota bacterium]